MNIILKILIVVLIFSSVGISIKQPKMHNKVLVYDSSFNIVEDEKDIIETKPTPIMEKTIEKTPVKNIVNNTYKKQIKNTTPIKVEQTKKKTLKPKPITQTTKVTKPKVLTETEELIAWNVWRSELQNQIMNDVSMPILPNGIIFKFSFRVDKYGKITKVQTWSYNPEYTPYAIQYIAPVIRSYQGRDILDFPEGSNRDYTEVNGGWKISSNSRFSTPADYNDIEKIRN